MKAQTSEERNIRLTNLNGVFQVISINLVSSFAGLFIKRLDAGDNLVSMLNSLPAFFSIAAIIIGMPLLSSVKNKKRASSSAYFITRCFYLIMAFVPFLSDKYRAAAFVFLYGALSFPGSIANYMWQSLLADTFSPAIRGKVLSVRNMLSTFAGTITTLTAGFILAKLSASRAEVIHYYQIFFVIAFIVGIFETASLLIQREPKDTSFREVVNENAKFSLDFFKTMIKQKEYVKFMICVVAFHFTWQMAWPLFLTYEVDYLHTNEMWSAIISTISGICTAFGYMFWRKFTDKHGNSLGLTIAAIGMGTCPILYNFTTHIRQVAYFTGFIGFSCAGILLILLNTLYEVAPRENRTTYIAFYNLATNITLVIAPWVGMQLYKMTTIKIALLIIGVLRLSSSLLFFRRHKSQNTPVSQNT
jgi:Na+/melibiose symporter-like transporter